jgi:hypothetical protein
MSPDRLEHIPAGRAAERSDSAHSDGPGMDRANSRKSVETGASQAPRSHVRATATREENKQTQMLPCVHTIEI